MKAGQILTKKLAVGECHIGLIAVYLGNYGYNLISPLMPESSQGCNK
jgi:hypothetical protein